MGNVPISCCRSKSPRLDSESVRNRNGLNAQYTSSNEHESSSRRKLSTRLIGGSGGAHSNDSTNDLSRSPQNSSQNILQHISEREPDDSETDPSSNALNRPIFATRSNSSKNHHCKLSASSSASNYNESYSSNLSSSLIRKQTIQNTPLTSSQDQGYNSSVSTNLTHYDGNSLSTNTFISNNATNTSLSGCGPTKDDQQQRIVDKINEQIHGLNIPNNSSTSDTATAYTSPSDSPNKAPIVLQASPIPTNIDNGVSNQENSYAKMKCPKRSYCSVNTNGLGQSNETCEDRFKASSCSTIFVDDSTISQPNLDQTIKCVSLAVYYHIQNRTSNEAKEIFDESIHPLRMPTQAIEHYNEQSQQRDIKDELALIITGKIPKHFESEKESEKKPVKSSHSNDSNGNTHNFDDEPDQETIYEFVDKLFKSAQLTSEYAITTLVYLERLMTYAEMDLAPKTWRRMFLGAILLSSKVWEDQAVWNVDYAQILEEISVDDINELERQFLELIQFNMNVPSSVYAKYYFHLRTLALKNGLTKEQSVLTTGKARELEAMSKVVNVAYGDWSSSTLDRKPDGKIIKKHTSFEKLRLSGHSRAVLM